MYLLIISSIIAISSTLFACDDSQLKKIEQIKAKINQQRIGLDLDKDLDDIKLHIAYSLTEKKDCNWNNDLETWYQTELARLKQHLELRRQRGAKIQEKHRERYKYEDQKIFEKSVYLGVNVKRESIEIPDVKIEDEKHLKSIAKRYSNISNYDLINYLSSSSTLIVKKHSLAMGHYTQDLNEKGQVDLKIVRDTLPLNPKMENKNNNKSSLVNTLPMKDVTLESTANVKEIPAIYKQWIKTEVTENQIRDEVERKKLQVEIARLKKLEDSKNQNKNKNIQNIIKNVGIKTGLPLEEIIKYKKVHFIIDISKSMDNYWTEARSYILTFDELIKSLGIKIQYRYVNNWGHFYDSTKLVSSRYKIDFSEQDINAREGMIVGTYNLNFSSDTIIIFLGDGECYNMNYPLSKEVLKTKSLKSKVIFKPFGDYDKDFFTEVPRKGDIVLKPGLVPLTASELDFIKKNVKK